ncbi:MAG: Na+/H+ antiporter NhaA [Dehalococcoidia bacterium]|nr:Na+/H+ antiporter NhaA [Dehalococcoidia bacterium]
MAPEVPRLSVQSQADASSLSRNRGVLVASLSKPVRDFLNTESGSAGILLGVAVVALLWANSPWSASYEDLWSTVISVEVGSRSLSMDLTHWINDGLMVLFFFVIGLELRHEISVGDLREKRRLIAPFVAGLGGLVVPALFYLLISPSGDAARGWGIVIGTDTAFLLGALALVGPKASTQLRVFLLSMTIADDLMAVTVIGVVYSDSINMTAVVIAALCLGTIGLLGRLGAWQTLAYGLAGFGAWLATIESGLHPSITGMLAGLLVVSRPPKRDAIDQAARLFTAFRQSPLPEVGYRARRSIQRVVSVNERFQRLLHPWTSYLIVPVFALANAGVDLRGGLLGEALTSPVMWGVLVGLVVGKPIGVGVFALGVTALRIGTLPKGLGPGYIIGGGALSGMGFSVSLLIVHLAFDSQQLRDEATVGVLAACALSVVTGWIIFRLSARMGAAPLERAAALAEPVDPDRDHIRGPVDAPLTLVEYGDFECPFCGQTTDVTRSLRERYGDQLRYVFRHLPLADVHPHAELAAEAAEAAAAQGRFWEMHDLLFRHQDELEFEDLVGYAGDLGLDVEQFTRDLTEESHGDRIREDVASAEAGGARGTPTFFVAGTRHRGPWDAESLSRALDAAYARCTEVTGR